MNGETIEVIGIIFGVTTAQFGLLYYEMRTINKRIDKYGNILSILCREHKINHGGDLLDNT